MADQALLEAEDWELARGLSLQSRRRLGGFSSGEMRSPASGGGIEFADYREYLHGDDTRGIDWSVYLRTEKLMVRLMAEEKELCLVVILDLSRSMAFGQPEKLRLAKRIACVLSGAALNDGNRIGIASVGSSLRFPLLPGRGRLSLASVVARISGLPVEADFDPASSMKDFASAWGRKCMAVFVSDLLYPGWSTALQGLSASGCEAWVLHILAPEELSPPIMGETTLVDMEDGRDVPLVADDAVLRRYRDGLESWLSEVRSTAGALGLSYGLIPSSRELSAVMRRDLKRLGLLC